MHSSVDAAPNPVRDGTGLQAVLWDMDGTLVDTEPYWIQGEIELVTAHGGSWSQEQAEALVGQSLVHSSSVLQSAGVELSTREIIDHLLGHVVRSVRRRIPWRPGARQLLADLKAAGVRCALVTMSEKPLAEEIRSQLPRDTFDFLVTGDMVERGKPHPEPYETALELLQQRNPAASVDNVVALEDSYPGVSSAQAAGLITVGIPHFIPLPDDDGRTHWDTLDGRSVADVQNLVDQRSTMARVG
ncbi:HAD family hydrolase [Arthrobacter castelli]|uniref:HAD family hydrolase n=1 Tax=Arthrobacter castelli TaxID=271431 RepID=UPI0006889971|nr:HAD family hydrolase [Arthrobacter castelli]